jgi:hypothetical protein
MTQPLDDRDVAPWAEEDEDAVTYAEERATAEYEAYRDSLNDINEINDVY